MPEALLVVAVEGAARNALNGQSCRSPELVERGCRPPVGKRASPHTIAAVAEAAVRPAWFMPAEIQPNDVCAAFLGLSRCRR